MDKALRYLGLAVRAGRLCVGAEDCGKQLQRHRRGAVAVAADASANTLAAAQRLCSGRDVTLLAVPYTKQQLGRAVGKAVPVALAYIMDEGLARAFVSAVEMDRKQEERE